MATHLALHSMKIHENGTCLAYMDTGPVERPKNPTLVCIHGQAFTSGRHDEIQRKEILISQHSFHAAVFARMAQYTKATQCRLVLLNRRDYRGSSEMREQEYADISKEDATSADLLSFIRARALEIAHFVASLIRQEDLPGLVSLLGWSLGVMTTLAFLANLDGVQGEDYRILELHLSSVIFWGKYSGHASCPGR